MFRSFDRRKLGLGSIWRLRKDESSSSSHHRPCLHSIWSSRLYISTPSSFSLDKSEVPHTSWPSRFKAARFVKSTPLSLQKHLRLMRVDKPIGVWLLYWPSSWSLALAAPAGSWPSPYLLALFGVGAFTMRSAGCVINDLWDRDYDSQVERTKSRPLASGEMQPAEAVLLLTGLLSISLAALLQLSWPSIAVGASSMFLVVTYPLAKRYTNWPQVVLGATINWGVLIAWAHLMPVGEWWKVMPLYFAAGLHTLIYDTIYAFQDTVDDARLGVKSSALRLGLKARGTLTGFAAAMTASLAASGLIMDQTWPYYLAVAGAASHIFWQVNSVNFSSAEDCWRKFKSNQWIGALIFTGIVAGNLLKNNESAEEDNESLDNSPLND